MHMRLAMEMSSLHPGHVRLANIFLLGSDVNALGFLCLAIWTASSRARFIIATASSVSSCNSPL
jgi:hypothetical protein